MAKKTIDWETVAKDKEVLSRAEALVKEGAAMGGVLPKEMCDELNALTGNKWTGKKYKEFCGLKRYKGVMRPAPSIPKSSV